MGKSPLTIAFLLTAALSVAMLAGCTAQAAPASAAIFVKDAASDDFTSLHVTFGEVAIHRDDEDHDDEDDEDGDDEERDDEDSSSTTSASATGNGSVVVSIREHDSSDDDGGWLVLTTDNATVDLMAYSGNASAFLAGADVPAGSYDKIRLGVLAARGTLHNGSQVPVEVPSGKLRIHSDFDVVPGEETAITLDFDLEKSLVKTGDGRYLLKPVIHMEDDHHERPDHDERERRESERRRHEGDDEHDEDDD